jgi:hypothetical protein
VDQLNTSLGPSIVVTTNVGDQVVVGPSNPLWVEHDPQTGEPRPYVRVRGRLNARILRAPFYELVEWANLEGERLSLTSQGASFDLGLVEGIEG